MSPAFHGLGLYNRAISVALQLGSHRAHPAKLSSSILDVYHSSSGGKEGPQWSVGPGGRVSRSRDGHLTDRYMNTLPISLPPHLSTSFSKHFSQLFLGYPCLFLSNLVFLVFVLFLLSLYFTSLLALDVAGQNLNTK